MNQDCQDQLVLQDRSGNKRGHQRQRFSEGTRVTWDSPVPQEIQVFEDPLGPLVDRRETRESQERQANGANQAKMVIQVLQDTRESKENQGCQVLQDEMEREGLKVNVDILALQDWCLAGMLEVRSVQKVSPGSLEHLDSKEIEDHKV